MSAKAIMVQAYIWMHVGEKGALSVSVPLSSGAGWRGGIPLSGNECGLAGARRRKRKKRKEKKSWRGSMSSIEIRALFSGRPNHGPASRTQYFLRHVGCSGVSGEKGTRSVAVVARSVQSRKHILLYSPSALALAHPLRQQHSCSHLYPRKHLYFVE